MEKEGHRARPRGTKQGQEDTTTRGKVIRGPGGIRPIEGSPRWDLRTSGRKRGSIRRKSEEE